MKFKSAKDLFNSKQQPTQSVDDFVAHMEKLAKFVGADEKMVLFAVQDQLRELTTQMNKSAASSVRQENQQRLRTPSPRRVRFEEERS